jgi:serine/threonine protein kinase/tetratricopeptide (TPR) repeat protein
VSEADKHAVSDWLPGQVLLDKYRILERIGAGGMGVVHSARRLSLGDIVAIKSVLPERSTPSNRQRFLREARALARIRHPNVVRVFDFGETEDRPFMVMEYLDGPTLGRVLNNGLPPLERALELFHDVCRAVEAGHRRGVVHRDLKPGNVMFDRSDDGGETVKVLDFGLARVTDDELEQSQAGLLVGTCGYMSPEQIEQGGGGPASDVFALGVILYEMVTGHRPFDAANQIATIMRICEGVYPPPREHVPGLPDAVVEAITAALQHSPEARPASPVELAERALGRTPGQRSQISSLSTLTEGGSRVVASRLNPADDTLGGSLGGSVGGSLGGSLGGSVGPSAPALRRPMDDATEAMVRPSEISEIISSDSGSISSSPSTRELTGIVRPSVIVSDVDEPARVQAAIGSPTFVGRRFELDTLLDLLAASSRDETPLAMVLGSEGMGRTRVLERFAAAAREQGATVFEGRFWNYEGARTQPGEIFQLMLGKAGEGLLDEAGPDLGRGFDRRDGSARLAAAFEAAALAGGGTQTLVLVLDDLHQALRSDLEFLTYLVRGRQRSVPIVVVASARSAAARSDAKTELSRWLLELATLKGRRILTLGRFGDEELRAWLDAVFHRLSVHPRDLRRLGRASGGVPYVLSELVRHLIASKRIVPADEGGGWACRALDRDVLPESVSTAIADQLAALPDPLRQLLETAAVLGEQLRFEVLERALADEELEVDELVDDAVARDLLAEQEPQLDGADLRFRSATVQRVLYDKLGARRRKKLHQVVVEALIACDPPERIAKLLAWHYRAIGDWPATLAFGLRAARESLDHHDSDAAELALEHAHAAVEALTRANKEPSLLERLNLESLAGTLDIRVGRFGEGSTRLRQARVLMERVLDADAELDLSGQHQIVELGFTIALELARCHLGVGELDRAVELGFEALELSNDLPDPDIRLAAEWNARVHLGHALGRFGRWQDAIDVLQPVIDTTPAPAMRVLHVIAMRELAWLEARRGSLADAAGHAQIATAEAKACGDPLAEYHAVSVCAVVESASGEHRKALALYREALRGARSLSLRRREMIEMANMSLTLLDLGMVDESLRTMLGVVGITRELGDKASSSDAQVGLGRILRARGDLDNAIDCFQRGYETCTEVGRHEYAAIALFELGRCELDRSQWAPAREVLLRARERMAELGSLLYWEVELALARAARGSNDQAARLEHAEAATAALQGLRGQLGPTGKVERGLAEIQAVIDG